VRRVATATSSVGVIGERRAGSEREEDEAIAKGEMRTEEENFELRISKRGSDYQLLAPCFELSIGGRR
jgi:hypothetical protein